jgi:hypothetical protein
MWPETEIDNPLANMVNLFFGGSEPHRNDHLPAPSDKNRSAGNKKPTLSSGLVCVAKLRQNNATREWG